jgi:small-conductance mechanosensitive channel
VLNAAWKLAAVLAGGLAAEWLLILVLRRPLRSLERHAPALEPAVIVPAGESATTPRRQRLSRAWQALQRLPFGLAYLILQLIPIMAFALLANLLPSAAIIDATGTVRLAIMSVLNAYVLLRAVLSLTRLFVSYEHPQLALVRLKPENAAYVEIWVRRVAILAMFGTALAEVAALLGLALAAHAALLKFVALLVHVCLVIIVLQCRKSIADLLRAPEDAHGVGASVRNRLADIWHFLAIFLVIASWIILAIQSQNGTDVFIRFVVVTIAILAAARLLSIVALGTLDRVFHLHPKIASLYPGLESRANRYYQLLRGTVAGLIWIGTLVALLEAWGVNSLAWFTPGHMGDRLVSALITIAIAAVIAIAIWESVNAALDRHVAQLVREERAQRVSRIKTLLPILRTSLLIAIVVILGLTVLNQVGVNIGPLLAGAGIVGVAVGFGSQKLVQDLITGLFLLFENAMQVGDWVTAGGLSGSVENLSIRTVRLRAGDGSLHIIPFSSVTSVTNTNRGIGNAAVSVNVALREDPDRVGDALKAIAAEMRQDPDFGSVMRSDLQLWGVDKVDASVMTIVGQIVCTDAGRWGVQREFNRRLKKRFEELDIRIANPTQTIVIDQPGVIDGPGTEPASAAEGGSAPETEAETEEKSTNIRQSPPPAALGHEQ